MCPLHPAAAAVASQTPDGELGSHIQALKSPPEATLCLPAHLQPGVGMLQDPASGCMVGSWSVSPDEANADAPFSSPTALSRVMF